MDDDKVLGHLLQIESEAAALVNDAQAEADRRLADSERAGRAAYDDCYRREAERLEGEFQQSTNAVKARYSKELADYREELNSLAADTAGFAALLGHCIAGDANA